MLLDPGPIPPLSTAGYDAPFDTISLTDFATAQIAPLDAVGVILDGILDPAAVVLDALPDDGSGDLLDYADAIFGQSADTLGTVPIQSIDAAALQVDEETVNVYAIVPGEAFQALPSPQVTGTPGDGGGPPPTQTRPGDIELSNVTRPGQDFQAGDSYKAQLHVAPDQGGGGAYGGLAVLLIPFRNQLSQPTVQLGTTDPNGFLYFSGTFQDTDVGAWSWQTSLTAADGTNYNGPDLQFTVVEPGSQGAAAPVTVSFIDQQLGYGTTVRVGDTWTLTVTGPPNSPVMASANINGVNFDWQQLGVTDDQGNFELQGSATPDQVGHWIEHYQVGASIWSGALEFDVINTLGGT